MSEDRVLHTGLPGYREYAQQVPARLVPGLWGIRRLECEALSADRRARELHSASSEKCLLDAKGEPAVVVAYIGDEAPTA